MWISHESSRRRAIFPVLVRENACRHLHKGECLIHGILCCVDCAHWRNVIHAEKFLRRQTYTPPEDHSWNRLRS
jgi:hypothetical protein